jgi:hypothetical protein
VSCKDTEQACAADARETSDACLDGCRDSLVSSFAACPKAGDRRACVVQARQGFESCATPCRSGAQDDLAGCRTAGRACVRSCGATKP